MATEIIKGYTHLQQELNKARDNLKDLNENIKKIIGRDPNNAEQYAAGNSFGAYARNDNRKRNSAGFEQNRRTEFDRRFSDGNAKRRTVGETKSVFSRLSGPPNRDTEYEKPRVYSRVIKEQPTREEVVNAQGGDEQSRARNRRIFGSLLGTLQKFTQEESKLKSKEEKKAQIEKKLEEQQKLERENLRKEKQCLFTDRKRQQLEIRTIETKLAKMRDLEAWEDSKKHLANYIKTKTKPHIYFLPKKMDSKMEKILKQCQEEHIKMMEQKRQEVMDSIAAVEERFQLDLKHLEESVNRSTSNLASTNPNNSKHDRMTADEDEEYHEELPHNSFNDDEHSDIIEGPALPSTMCGSNFKITIHNKEVKQEKDASPIIVRLLDGPETMMDVDSTSDNTSYLAPGENFQITFKTDASE